MCHAFPTATRSAQLLVLLALTPATHAASAQAPAASARPAVIFVVREVVKPGHEAAHLRHETEWAAALGRAGFSSTALGMVSTSGASEAWWLLPYPSHEAMGKDQMSFAAGPGAAVMEKYSSADAAHIDGWRSMTLTLRPDLTKGTPANIARSRGVEVTTWRIRPGHDPQFVEATNLYAALAQRAGVAVSFATYEVSAGAPWGTYLSFVAFGSMAEIDRMQGDGPKIFGTATAEEMARMNGFLRESVMTAETNRFSFDPNVSSVPEDFITQDGAFWTPSWKKAAARGAARR